MTNPLQQVLDDAVATNRAPFVVAMTGDAAGITWSGAAGAAREDTPAGRETVFRIYSMTKAVGATAAMILIERGEMSLDTPVADILHDFAELRVLEGFDGSTPRLRTATTAATVRHLATHTSGLVYESWDADMSAWMAATGAPSVMSGTRDGLRYPLAFDPGTRWGYGIGSDWLGQVVEAVDGRRIDAFCRTEIFEPLKMTDTAFEADGLTDRLAAVTRRGSDGALRPHQTAPPSHPEVYGMGHALYATAPDYLRFLRMFLRRGELDGNRILRATTVEEMLANQIGELRTQPMRSTQPALSADVDLFPRTPTTHSFGFFRNEEDVPGRRSAGSQWWAGVLNTHYWFDPATDVAGLYMTQLLPFADPGFMQSYVEFERAVYAS